MYKNNSIILNTLDIPNINGFDHLAEQLSITKELLYFLCFKQKYCYKSKIVPKKDGSGRIISIPKLPLKVVQKWILKEILEKIRVSKQTMAFVPKKNGLKDNAEAHRENIFILEMDLTNFFGTIDKKRVFWLFYNIGYNKKVSETLANLCTYKDILPQGAVTSPYIANLVAFHMDARINGYCKKRGIVYTRYADDLSFSSNNQTKLNFIAKMIEEIVKDEGFTINSKKTRYFSEYVKKTVVGITLNHSELHVDKKFKETLRVMIYQAITKKDYSNIEKIRGSIAYIDSIEPGYKTKALYRVYRILRKGKDEDLIEEYNKNRLFPKIENGYDIYFDNAFNSVIAVYNIEEQLMKKLDKKANG